MYDHETGTFFDGNLPHDNQLVDGYTTNKEYITGYDIDFIEELEKEHEPDLEQYETR